MIIYIIYKHIIMIIYIFDINCFKLNNLIEIQYKFKIKVIYIIKYIYIILYN